MKETKNVIRELCTIRCQIVDGLEKLDKLYESIEKSNDMSTINSDDVLKGMNGKLKKIVKELHDYSVYQNEKTGRWFTYVYDETKAEKRKRITAKNENELYEKLIKYYNSPEQDTDMTLNKLYPMWVEHKGKCGYATGTISRNKSDWKKYYLGTAITKLSIKKLTHSNLKEWATSIVEENHLNARQYANVSSIIRQILEYAVDEGYLEKNPMDSVKLRKNIFEKPIYKKAEDRIFLPDEYVELHRMAWDDFNNEVKEYVLTPLAIIVQSQTAARIGELCALKHEDIIDDEYILISRMLRRDEDKVVNHTKGASKERLIPLTDELKRVISAIVEYKKSHNIDISEAPYLFSMDSKHSNYRAIDALYKKYSKKLGVNKSSHTLRRTVGSYMNDAGASIAEVQNIYGHQQMSTTMNSYLYNVNAGCNKDLLNKVLNPIELKDTLPKK